MIYQNDIVTILLSVMKADGTTASVTTVPTIQIINAANDGAQLSSPGTMTLVSGSTSIYKYRWQVPPSTANGTYLAVTSYVADGIVYTGKLLKEIAIGDTRITDVVALDSTVAKDASVAKDSTVAHASDLQAISPSNSPTVLAIKAKTDNLPVDPVGFSAIQQMITLLTNINDATFGNIYIDKSSNPRTLTMKRPDNTTLAVFYLNESDSLTSKEKQ